MCRQADVNHVIECLAGSDEGEGGREEEDEQVVGAGHPMPDDTQVTMPLFERSTPVFLLE
jgi:hypothetical protein